MSLKVQHFYDEKTFTLTYVVFDIETHDAIIVDPVLNYDAAASKMSMESIDKVDKFIKENELKLHYIMETHAHADHLTGSVELKNRYPQAKVAIGKHITAVQSVFKDVFFLRDLATDGSQFDVLLDEENPIKAGSFEIKTIFTPGHTPACSTFQIDDMLFTGDTMFMPDFGTGRCDFPKGSAEDLYDSIQKLYQLPDETRFFTGHDYQPGGRELKFESTIGEAKTQNIQLKGNTSKEEFVKFRTERDATLSVPKLLLPSVQINIDAGRMPKVEENGMSYIKIPMR